MPSSNRSRADVVGGVCVVAVLAAVALPMVAADRDRSRQGKDAAQSRQIHEALTTWAASHGGALPLPSAIDTLNRTIAAGLTAQRVKDDTGNTFSLLIFNGLLTPEMLVSPVESNTAVRIDTGYEYANPSGAVVPAEALWDPRFAGTPGDLNRRQAGVGSVSYAHLIPFQQRLAMWSIATGPDVVLLSNRGPQYNGALSDEGTYSSNWTLRFGAGGTASNTLLFYAPRHAWTGHVLLADGRVTFSPRADNRALTYQRSGTPSVAPDNLFVNESDDSTRIGGSGALRGTNAYLRQISGIIGSDAAYTITIFRD